MSDAAGRARLRAFLDGVRLRCPNCRQGRMYATPLTFHAECRRCGTDFDAAGDWTGAVMVAKFLIGGVILLGVMVITLVYRPPLWVQAAWVFGVGGLLLVSGYKWVKGAWIGFLWAQRSGRAAGPKTE